MKKCPFCAEEIQDAAIKCRYCGSLLDQPPIAKYDASARDAITPEVLMAKACEGFAHAMLAVPLIACLLIWFWIGSMSLLQGPASSLALVGIATIIVTAVLAGADAQRLGIGSPSGPRKGSGPVAWALFVALMWIIGYPAYLNRRKLYGGRGYLVVAILLAVVFVASWSGMGSIIDAQQAKIRSILR